jgi:hypothetical protein
VCDFGICSESFSAVDLTFVPVELAGFFLFTDIHPAAAAVIRQAKEQRISWRTADSIPCYSRVTANFTGMMALRMERSV